VSAEVKSSYKVRRMYARSPLDLCSTKKDMKTTANSPVL
jgi:hypothetical protein